MKYSNVKFDDKYFTSEGINDALEESNLTTWNSKIENYDKDKFPFDQWMLNRVKIMGYELDSLTQIHEVIPDNEVYLVSKTLCADTGLPEFQEMLNNFVREVLVPVGKLQTPVAVQRFTNVRIMLPSKPTSIFPFHTGLLYGHGPASRSIWMPLTDVSADEDYTSTMQIISVERSRELLKHAIENRYSVNQMTKIFGDESYPLKTKPGNMVLFTQENIHGNFINVTGKTRVSIDFRVAEAQYGNYLGRKRVGGYFKIIGDSEETTINLKNDGAGFHNGKRNVHYVQNATPIVREVPVHLQRYMLKEYSDRFDLKYEFELFELEDMSHLPTLQYIINELKNNVCLYSIYSLPEDKEFRQQIISAALDKGVILHFVNEDMSITNQKEADYVEMTLQFARYGED